MVCTPGRPKSARVRCGIAFAAVCAAMATVPVPAEVVETRYHLPARQWAPLEIPASRYLDVIEGICRFTVRHQDDSGAIIDPFLHREHQYATPYFAYAVATLVDQGRASDLLPAGIRAMEHGIFRKLALGPHGRPVQSL